MCVLEKYTQQIFSAIYVRSLLILSLSKGNRFCALTLNYRATNFAHFLADMLYHQHLIMLLLFVGLFVYFYFCFQRKTTKKKPNILQLEKVQTCEISPSFIYSGRGCNII